MIRFITKKLGYGLLVLMGVVVVVFFLFQGFGDPARLVLGQSGDSTTMSNIKKELALDKPTSKQFLLYLNDVSPIALHSASDIEAKKLRGFFFTVGDKQLAFKIPYLRRSYQSKKQVSEILMEAIPGTLLLAFAAMFVATFFGILLGMLAAIKKTPGWIVVLCLAAYLVFRLLPFLWALLLLIFLDLCSQNIRAFK